MLLLAVTGQCRAGLYISGAVRRITGGGGGGASHQYVTISALLAAAGFSLLQEAQGHSYMCLSRPASHTAYLPVRNYMQAALAPTPSLVLLYNSEVP